MKQRHELERRALDLQRALQELQCNKGEKPDHKPDFRPGEERPFQPDRKPFSGSGKFAPGQGPLDRRINELEHKLERLMDVVEHMRRPWKTAPSAPAADSPSTRRPRARSRKANVRRRMISAAATNGAIVQKFQPDQPAALRPRHAVRPWCAGQENRGRTSKVTGASRGTP